MKRVLLAALTLIAAGLMAGPSAAQAVVHHTTGTVDLGTSGTPCVANLTYSADDPGTGLPGTGVISSIALPSGCKFYGSTVTIPDLYLEATFNTDGTVELDGTMTISYGTSGFWLCDYTTSQSGNWNSGLPTAFLSTGALVRQTSGSLCDIPAMNNLAISAVFLD